MALSSANLGGSCKTMLMTGKPLDPGLLGTLLEMASDIRNLIGQHHVTYEVLPYYVVVDIHKKDAQPSIG